MEVMDYVKRWEEQYSNSAKDFLRYKQNEEVTVGGVVYAYRDSSWSDGFWYNVYDLSELEKLFKVTFVGEETTITRVERLGA